ncbi:MAG: A24 family peptidase C-terminal domain-containing protein [Archaeoglobaceae archaeon]
MNSLEVLEAVKIAFVSIFLIYACFLDFKSRIVPNRVWKAMLIAVAPMVGYEVYYAFVENSISLISAMLGATFMIVFAYMIYAINAYGGADAKALMSLALIFPFYPKIGDFPLLNQGFGIFAFSVLANSVIFAPFMMVFLLVRNLLKEGFEGLLKNPLFYMAGYRIQVEKIRFHNLFEFVDEKGELKKVKRAVECDEEKLRRLKSCGIEKVWVTPALPFMIFITIGFFIAILLGDVFVEILEAMLKK